MKSDEKYVFIRFHQISPDFIRFHQISNPHKKPINCSKNVTIPFSKSFVSQKTSLRNWYVLAFASWKNMRNRKQKIIWPVHIFSQRSEKKFPFPRFQRHQANNHLTCSYLFPKVWKQVPFPKVPETPSKQSCELFIPSPKGLKTSSLSQFIPFLKGPKAADTLSQG